MITRLRINNFKSLVDFTLPSGGGHLPKFSCLIGLNGAGKSTLLQAFDFVAHLHSGDISTWLQERGWKPRDLTSKLGKSNSPSIEFEIQFRFDEDTSVRWEGRYNTDFKRCTEELIGCNGQVILKSKSGTLSYAQDKEAWLVDDRQHPELFKLNSRKLHFEGSITSVLNLSDEHPAFEILSHFLRGLKSFELLSPHLMRMRAKSAKDIGVGGEKLSAFLWGLKNEHGAAIEELMRKFYPRFRHLEISNIQAGWKNLRVMENYKDTPLLETDATHLNDGFLRVLAIVSQAYSQHTVLLFDEIENGINPEMLEAVMDFLTGLEKQVIVTTHSPMVLNYIEDDIARQGVILLYKTPNGRTQSIPFFKANGMEEKLRALGPGEVMIDTNIQKLVEELSTSS